MGDEEVRLAMIEANDHIEDIEVRVGNEVPSREQNPYLGEMLRRLYTEQGDTITKNNPELLKAGHPSAEDVSRRLPGYPVERMDDLRELLHVISRVGVWARHPHWIIEDLAHNKLNEPRDRWLRFVAEGRLDDVYREMLWIQSLP